MIISFHVQTCLLGPWPHYYVGFQPGTCRFGSKHQRRWPPEAIVLAGRARVGRAVWLPAADLDGHIAGGLRREEILTRCVQNRSK